MSVYIYIFIYVQFYTYIYIYIYVYWKNQHAIDLELHYDESWFHLSSCIVNAPDSIIFRRYNKRARQKVVGSRHFTACQGWMLRIIHLVIHLVMSCPSTFTTSKISRIMTWKTRMEPFDSNTQRCKSSTQRCKSSTLRCNSSTQKWNRSVQRCNSSTPRCNSSTQKWNRSVQRCDSSTQRCNSSI